MDVKERLQQLMNERGWTIYRVAKEADIPWSTVRNMFKRNTEPSIATLECLCKGMGMTLPQFSMWIMKWAFHENKPNCFSSGTSCGRRTGN